MKGEYEIMDITRRTAGDGGLQSTRELNESGPDSYEKYFWLIDDHPSRREDADLELSRALWGDNFQTGRDRLDEWDAPHADPGAEFDVHFAGQAGSGADFFF